MQGQLGSRALQPSSGRRVREERTTKKARAGAKPSNVSGDWLILSGSSYSASSMLHGEGWGISGAAQQPQGWRRELQGVSLSRLSRGGEAGRMCPLCGRLCLEPGGAHCAQQMERMCVHAACHAARVVSCDCTAWPARVVLQVMASWCAPLPLEPRIAHKEVDAQEPAEVEEARHQVSKEQHVQQLRSGCRERVPRPISHADFTLEPLVWLQRE